MQICAKVENKKKSREPLPKRLRAQPTGNLDYVYHVTRGVHLVSIKKHGLIAQDKSEYHYASKRNWFSSNLGKAYQLYGRNIIHTRYRFSSVLPGKRFAEKYFQGVAVLRCKPAHLFSKGYTIDLDLSIVGEERLGPQSIELFIDGTWAPLNTVEFRWSLWPVIYKFTGFLRVRP